MKNIAIVLGTRPEVLKNYSIVKALERRGLPFCVLHIGQHDDPLMSSLVFEDLNYKPTEVFSEPFCIGTALDWVIKRLDALRVDLVLVNGDTTASLIGGLAALYSNRQLAHVEAGLRCYDQRMIEERIRIMVDSIANYLFTYTDSDTEMLLQRKDLRGSIHQVGNTTVDLIAELGDSLSEPACRKYAFVTLHRRELLCNAEALKNVLGALQAVSHRFNLMIFPVHPHTLSRMQSCGIMDEDYPGIQFCKPMLPMSALAHIKHADLVITDGGVIQEEAYLFGIPCITVRENTERHLTIKHGANVLTGVHHKRKIIQAIEQSLLKGRKKYPNIYGDPGVGDRIIDILLNCAPPAMFRAAFKIGTTPWPDFYRSTTTTTEETELPSSI